MPKDHQKLVDELYQSRSQEDLKAEVNMIERMSKTNTNAKMHEVYKRELARLRSYIKD